MSFKLSEKSVSLPLFDTHFHALEMSVKGMNTSTILKSLEKERKWGCVEIAISTRQFPERVALASQHPGLKLSAGLHPNFCGEFPLADHLDIVRDQCTHPLIVAVGETGLDYYRNQVPVKIQKEAFAFHLDLGSDLGTPVIIHNRNADEDVLSMIESSNCRNGILHCFSSGKDEMRRALNLGFHISFGGPITFKKNHELRDLATFVPKDFLLIETDSPYLAPEPMRGKLNSPANLQFIFEILCSTCSTDREEMAYSLWRNAERLFTRTR